MYIAVCTALSLNLDQTIFPLEIRTLKAQVISVTKKRVYFQLDHVTHRVSSKASSTQVDELLDYKARTIPETCVKSTSRIVVKLYIYALLD